MAFHFCTRRYLKVIFIEEEGRVGTHEKERICREECQEE